jgi:hypothetical protein
VHREKLGRRRYLLAGESGAEKIRIEDKLERVRWMDGRGESVVRKQIMSMLLIQLVSTGLIRQPKLVVLGLWGYNCFGEEYTVNIYI